MKFRDYIKTFDELSEIVDIEDTLSNIYYNYIPLSIKDLEKIFKVKKTILFHMLDITNIPKLEKIQKTNIAISCFTKVKTEKIFKGASGMNLLQYPVLSVLNGSYTIGANEDLYTDFDSSGLRWIKKDEIKSDMIYNLFSKIGDKIEEKYKKELEKVNLSFDLVGKYMTNPGALEKIVRLQLLSIYFKVTSDILKRNKKHIQDLLNKDTTSYNEVLGYNFIIEKLYIHESVYKSYQHDIQMPKLEIIPDNVSFMKIINSYR